jgi:hypothetical protein
MTFGDETMPAPLGRPPVRSDADGRFTLENLFGSVLVRVSGGSGWWLDRVLLDSTDITDVPMELPASSDRLVVVLTREGASLSGATTTADGKPAVDASVVVFSADEARWQPRASTTRTAVAADGKYLIQALKPGRYLAMAVPRNTLTLSAGPEYFKLLAEHATPVVLGDREQKTLNLQVVTLPR